MTNDLGKYIRELRGNKSLRDFARQCNLSHTHIDSIEKGIDFRTGMPVNISIESLAKISRITGADLALLIKIAIQNVPPSENISPFVRPSRIAFKDFLGQRRKELTLTQQAIAEAVGVSTPTVQRWESGEIKNLRRDRIQKLAAILETSIETITSCETLSITSGISEINEEGDLLQRIDRLDVDERKIVTDLISFIEHSRK